MVRDGQVTDEVHYLTADDEKRHVIAQASVKLDDEGRFVDEAVLCRLGDGEPA